MTTNRFAASALKLFLIGVLVIFTSGAGLFASENDGLATDKTITVSYTHLTLPTKA